MNDRTKLEQLDKMTYSVAATEIEPKQTTTVPEKQTSPAPSQSAPDPTGFVPIQSLAYYQEGIMLASLLFPDIPHPPALPMSSAKPFHPNAFNMVASTMIGYCLTVDFPNRTEETKRRVRSDKSNKTKSIRR